MAKRREFLGLFGWGGTAWLASRFRFPGKHAANKEARTVAYTAKDFGSLIGMAGFSETLLKNHFTLYQGYVTNTNKSLDLQAQMLKDGKTGTPEFAEINDGSAGNGTGCGFMSSISGTWAERRASIRPASSARRLAAEFGSLQDWEKDFRAAGAMRGIGWVVLYLDSASGRMFNSWINEHDTGHPAGCAPLLVMDVFEHAYMTDYGIKKADYIEAFFKNIDWAAVAARLG